MKLKIVGIMALLLLALGTASACVVCPSGYPVLPGGDIVAGTSFTLTAPDATSWSWMGTIQGQTGVINLGNTKVITVPSSFTAGLCGREVAVYATATNDKGCVWMQCIWFNVKCVCPTPQDFCKGQATPATEGSFIPLLPPSYYPTQNTYKWYYDGTNNLFGVDGHPSESFLDGLAVGNYVVKLCINAGMDGMYDRCDQYCGPYTVVVSPIPEGNIVKG